MLNHFQQTAVAVCLQLLAAMAALCQDVDAAPARPGRPNVVVIVADDLGWADVGFHRAEMRTPNLDALVETGLELDTFYATPMCTPTRVALMTGRHPSRFGTHCTQASNARALPMGTRTLASLFQEAGFDTALIGKWHLGSKRRWGPNHFGFDYSFGSLAGAIGPYDHRYRLTRPQYTQTFHRNHEFVDEEGHITDLTAEEAVRWIERERHRPFFLYVPFNAVHVPIVEEQKWIDANAHITAPDRRLFAAAVTHMDHAIGEIVAALKQTGQREDTLIVFFSDNGGLNNHRGGTYPPPDPALANFSLNVPLRGQKRQTFEGGIRVPALANWPGVLQPDVVEAPLHAVDWYPTLAGLLGLAPADDQPLDGQDIWPILTGQTQHPPERSLYWVTGKHRNWVALRHGNWKIVRQLGKKWQLFNLADDRSETEDLADRHPDKLRDLVQKYEAEWAKDGGNETLFDGKTLRGWTTLDGEPVKRGWEVVDGMIVCRPGKPRAGHIITERPFRDFRLSFEWKIAERGNSGLKYRVRRYFGGWYGCEYQILDDQRYPAKMSPQQTSGALYALYAPNENKQLRPVGEFNSSTIVVQGDHIEHWLNGQLIVSATVGDDEWHRRVAESKFNDLPEFGLNRIGRIMLTDHYSEAWYRNFQFEPLPGKSESIERN